MRPSGEFVRRSQVRTLMANAGSAICMGRRIERVSVVRNIEEAAPPSIVGCFRTCVTFECIPMEREADRKASNQYIAIPYILWIRKWLAEARKAVSEQPDWSSVVHPSQTLVEARYRVSSWCDGQRHAPRRCCAWDVIGIDRKRHTQQRAVWPTGQWSGSRVDACVSGYPV